MIGGLLCATALRATGKSFAGCLKPSTKAATRPGIVIFDEVIQVLLHCHACLVATGNDMTQSDVAIEHQRVGNGRA